MYKVTIINGNEETVIHSPYFGDRKLTTGSIKQGINVADNFTFSILPNSPGYHLIKPLSTLVTVENIKTGQVEFDGFVYMSNDIMGEAGVFGKSFTAVSELGYLKQSCQRHGEYHDITVRDFLQVIIDNHNADVADDPIDKKFEVGIVEVDSSTGTLYRYLDYENTLETIKDKLLERLGGELRIRKENGVRYLDYLWSIGEQKSTEIRLAKNLKSVTKEVDPTEVVTRLIPLGERIESDDPDATDASQARLTIESVNDGKDYIVDKEMEQALGTIVYGTQVWDDVTVPTILKTRGEQWLAEQNRIKEQHQITALDLSLIGLDTDSFEVGNWYPVINPVMGIDDKLRVVGKTIDIIEPNNNTLTIGDRFKKASEYQRDALKTERKVVELEEIAEIQRKRIYEIRNEVENVETNLRNVQQVIEEVDLEELPSALDALVQAIQDLNDAIDAIPIYDKATPTQDGLMSKEDKTKLDLLTVTVATNLDALRQKLNLITVTQAINLDDLEARVTALENGP